MLVKIWPDRRPHRVKHEVDSLAACQFRCGNEVRITGNQNELVDLPFVRKRRDVQPYAHIDALLAKVESEIVITDTAPLALSINERLERVRCKLPAYQCGGYVAETKSDFA